MASRELEVCPTRQDMKNLLQTCETWIDIVNNKPTRLKMKFRIERFNPHNMKIVFTISEDTYLGVRTSITSFACTFDQMSSAIDDYFKENLINIVLKEAEN